MNNMKKIFSLLLAALMVFSVMSVSFAKTETETRSGIGMDISGFNAHLLLSEDTVTGDVLGDYELTFINYWATWCGPCVSEMPHIRSMYNHYLETPENDVNVLGAVSISGSCTESSANQFLNSNGYTWTNVVPDSVLRAVFNTSGYIPQTLIVDSHGVVRDHIVGSFSNYNQLLQYVEMWLEVFREHDGETCTVSFVCDATGETLLTQEVAYGGKIITPPSSDLPEVEGYTFSSWQYNDPNILETFYEPVEYLAMGDCTVTAHYNVKRYLVRFYDSYNNSILSTQQVEHGHAANPPAEPNHEDVGLYFVGWDTDFSCITQVTNIHSIYRPVGDVTGDNAVTVSDALMILRGAMQIFEFEDITFADMNGNGSVEVTDAIMALRVAMGLL